MQSAEGKMGRVFVIRLEEGDLLPAALEQFAEEKKIKNGFVLLVGGIGRGQVVVGPRISDQMPPDAMLLPIDGAHEVVGLGILAPGENGKIGMHMHAALGRSGKTTTGCIRPGVKTGWWRRLSSMKSPVSMPLGFSIKRAALPCCR